MKYIAKALMLVGLAVTLLLGSSSMALAASKCVYDNIHHVCIDVSCAPEGVCGNQCTCVF